MKKLASLLLLLPLFSFGQGQFPVGGNSDTIRFGNIKVVNEAFYNSSPTMSNDLKIPSWGDVKKSTIPEMLKFNYVGNSEDTIPIIRANPTGWDQIIREIGNPKKFGDTIIEMYSGQSPPFDLSYIGIFVSFDNGKTRTKMGALGDGQIINIPSEDPFFQRLPDGSYYIVAELKASGNVSLGIGAWTASNFTDLVTGNLTYLGTILSSGTGWEARDVSSPTFEYDTAFHLYYEGRGTGQDGAMGLANSPDGSVGSYVKNPNNPIMTGTNLGGMIKWALHVVPDDIFENNGNKYLIFHGFSVSDNVFCPGMAVSSNGGTIWKDFLGDKFLSEYGTGRIGHSMQVYFDGYRYKIHYTPNSDDTVIRYGYFAVNPTGFDTVLNNYYRKTDASFRFNGNIGQNVAPSATDNVRSSRQITGATTAYGIRQDGVVQSDVTSNGIYNRVTAATAAGSYTLTNLIHYYSTQGTIGAGSTVTNQMGFNVNSTLIGGTNNYGFYGDIPAATGRYNFYANGTAVNYMNSRLGLGVTSPLATLHLRQGSSTLAPIIMNSGALLTTPIQGAIEFLTDKAYLTIGTGTARKEYTLNDVALNSSIVPVTTTNGRLTNTTVTTTELGYVSGVTSSIQTQLNNRAIITNLTGSGNGVSTAIAVTLPASSTNVMVGAANAAASGITYWTVSGTTLTINYTAPPASGTNNLSYWIEYK